MAAAWHFRGLLVLCVLASAASFTVPSLFERCLPSPGRAAAGAQITRLSASSSPSDPADLLIIGAGTLGSLLAEQYMAKFPGANVIAETKSNKRHDALAALGVSPRIRDHAPPAPAKSVVFCAAPGGNDDYVGETKRAVSLWGGPKGGRMVMTSSAGILSETDGGVVDESSPIDDGSPRTAKLKGCEDAVLGAGGAVVRLAGLYALDRGAHSFWIKSGKCTGLKDGLIGLVSYEDAAGSVLSCLTCERSVEGEVFLVADDSEQTRKDIIDSAMKTKMWGGYKYPELADSGDPIHAKGIGKRYNTAKIKTTGWVPKYPSFDAFCELNK